jgi:glycosyltransferase involved in cell wall biosynthesis
MSFGAKSNPVFASPAIAFTIAAVKASVIICTRNPRPDFLAQVFAALKRQTLPASAWELLVVDNASSTPLPPRLDLSWHPSPRIVREETLGLTHARLRGIAETTGDVLVFVDDDNVLDAHYVEQALAIAEKDPRIGSWGGNMHAQFEQPPPEWTRRYWPMLAVREVTQDHIGTSPIGAGLCVRRSVASRYQQLAKECPLRLALDRAGNSLVSGGDVDLARSAHAVDLEMGVFTALQLTHLIPTQRLTEDYLLRLTEAAEFTNHLLAWLDSPGKTPPPVTWQKRVRAVYDSIRKFGRKRRFHQARRRGINAFYQILPLLKNESSHLDAVQWVRDWNSRTPRGAP